MCPIIALHHFRLNSHTHTDREKMKSTYKRMYVDIRYPLSLCKERLDHTHTQTDTVNELRNDDSNIFFVCLPWYILDTDFKFIRHSYYHWAIINGFLFHCQRLNFSHHFFFFFWINFQPKPDRMCRC